MTVWIGDRINARGPRVFKGALVSISSTNPKPHVISFQYNPATLKRSLKPLMVGGEAGDLSQSARITGASTETFSVEIEIDAADDLEAGDAVATSLGIQPQRHCHVARDVAVPVGAR